MAEMLKVETTGEKDPFLYKTEPRNIYNAPHITSSIDQSIVRDVYHMPYYRVKKPVPRYSHKTGRAIALHMHTYDFVQREIFIYEDDRGLCKFFDIPLQQGKKFIQGDDKYGRR